MLGLIIICDESSKGARAAAFFTGCKFLLGRVMVASSLLEEKALCESFTHRNVAKCATKVQMIRSRAQHFFFSLFFLFFLFWHLPYRLSFSCYSAFFSVSQTLWSASVEKLWMSILIPLMSADPATPPTPLFCPNRKQWRFILQSAVHPRRPMIGDVYGGEKPGMTNKG